MKECRICHKPKPPEQFIAGKAKPRVSSACAPCRAKASAKHRRNFYAKLPPDRRHTLTHKKRAEGYGVEHVEYSRMAVMARWGYTCGYCGAPAAHMDHITPLSRGGADTEGNVIPACAGCNLSKGAKTLAEWALTFGPEVPF